MPQMKPFLCIYILWLFVTQAYSQFSELEQEFSQISILEVYNVSASSFPMSEVQVVNEIVYYVSTLNEIVAMQIENAQITHTLQLNSENIVSFALINTTFGVAVYSTKTSQKFLAFFNPANLSPISDPVILHVPLQSYPSCLLYTQNTPEGVIFSIVEEKGAQTQIIKIDFVTGSVLESTAICPPNWNQRDLIPISDWSNYTSPGFVVVSCVSVVNEFQLVFFDLGNWTILWQLDIENSIGAVAPIVTMLLGYAVRTSPTEIEYYCYSLYARTILASATFTALSDSDNFIYYAGGNARVVLAQLAPSVSDPVASQVTLLGWVNIDGNLSVDGNLVSKEYMYSGAGFSYQENYYLWAEKKTNDASLPCLVVVGPNF